MAGPARAWSTSIAARLIIVALRQAPWSNKSISRARLNCAGGSRNWGTDFSGAVRPRRKDRKSVVSGKSVSVRVDLGGRRIIKKKNSASRVELSLAYSAHYCFYTQSDPTDS